MTGQERWHLRGLGDVAEQPSLASGTAYVVTTDPIARRSTLFAVSADSGQRTATVPFPGMAGSPVTVGDTVVVPLDEGPLVALAAA